MAGLVPAIHVLFLL